MNLSSKKPYFDDFDDTKNYYKILFRPGNAVQARELTQIQSILQDQIAKFGNHVFQNGSVVIPGNTNANLSVDYIKVESFANNRVVTPSQFVGNVIVGQESGVKATVETFTEATETDPLTFYVTYISGGGVGSNNTFLPTENVFLQSNPGVFTTTKGLDENYAGKGSLAYINKGVFYVNGYFVSVEKQATVISKYTQTPSTRVLLKIDEQVTTSNEDLTLLDPAQGTFNFAAPGGDRLKISLTLTSLPLDSVVTEDYIELMRFEQGELLEQIRYPKYSEIDKIFAQRTDDIAGDYIVRGLEFNVSEHLRVGKNGGAYVESAGGDKNKINYTVSDGRAYLKGFAIDNISTKKIDAFKARTDAHVLQTTISTKPSYGQYLLVDGLVRGFDTVNRQTINLFDKSTATGGTLIGTAKVFALDYHAGNPNSNPICKLYITDLAFVSGLYNIESIGSVRGLGTAPTQQYARVLNELYVPSPTGDFLSGDNLIVPNVPTRYATVSFWESTQGLLYVHRSDNTKDIPIVGDTITVTGGASGVVKRKVILTSVGQSSAIFRLPKSATKNLTDANDQFDMNLTTYARLVITTGTSATNVISSGMIAPLEVGNFLAIDDTGVLPISQFSLNNNNTQITRTTNASNGDIFIFTQINYNNSAPRVKTPTSVNGEVKSPAPLVTLNSRDVFKIKSIISGGVDITNSYQLVSGQTDYSYEFSYLILKNGSVLPTQDLTISYDYFSHGPGNFFSVDSYSGLGEDYLDKIPSYVSNVDGKKYDLRDCIDFRTSGTSSSLVVIDSLLTSSVKRFMGRYDSIALDKNGNIVVVTGQPSDNPVIPTISNELLSLGYLFIPAYTYKVSDCFYKQLAPSRFTMASASKLKQRVAELENYSTLTAAENNFIQTEILDARTGLDRFKTGYIVEVFDDPRTIGSVYTKGYSATARNGVGLYSAQETTACDLFITTLNANEVQIPTYNPTTKTINPPSATARYANTNGVITLPYTERAFIDQNLSSRIVNVNPFNVVSWEGNIFLYPSVDNWIERFDRAEIVRNETVFVDQQSPAAPVVPVIVPPFFSDFVFFDPPPTNVVQGVAVVDTPNNRSEAARQGLIVSEGISGDGIIVVGTGVASFDSSLDSSSFLVSTTGRDFIQFALDPNQLAVSRNDQISDTALDAFQRQTEAAVNPNITASPTVFDSAVGLGVPNNSNGGVPEISQIGVQDNLFFF